MEEQKVQAACMAHFNTIPDSKRLLYKAALENADDNRYNELMSAKLKNANTATILSIFLGIFGVDRFYLGDVVIGIVKLAIICLAPILFAVLAIANVLGKESLMIFNLFCILIANVWWFADIFICRNRIKYKNYQILMIALCGKEEFKLINKL